MKNLYQVAYTSEDDFDLVQLQSIEGDLVITELLGSTRAEDEKQERRMFHIKKWKQSAKAVEVKDLTLFVGLPFISSRIEEAIKNA